MHADSVKKFARHVATITRWVGNLRMDDRRGPSSHNFAVDQSRINQWPSSRQVRAFILPAMLAIHQVSLLTSRVYERDQRSIIFFRGTNRTPDTSTSRSSSLDMFSRETGRILVCGAATLNYQVKHCCCENPFRYWKRFTRCTWGKQLLTGTNYMHSAKLWL